MMKFPIGEPKVVVYSELTMTRVDLEQAFGSLPYVEFRKPIGRFELVEAVREGFHAAYIVDGVFHQKPSISQGDILEALRSGMRVSGAASMGALRAAELAPLGMLGYGEIFHFIQSHNEFCDDWVGQVFFDSPSGIVPLSFTYLDFLFNLGTLEEQALISKGDFDKLRQMTFDIYYPSRTFEHLKETIRSQTISQSEYEHLTQIAFKALHEMPQQKKIDAIKGFGEFMHTIAADQTISLRLCNV